MIDANKLNLVNVRDDVVGKVIQKLSKLVRSGFRHIGDISKQNATRLTNFSSANVKHATG